MVIAEIFENDEKGFLKYLEARLPLYKEEKFIINNEMDFLGLYLSRDFNKTIKAFKRGDRVVVSTEYRNRLDNYFIGLYEDKQIKKPQKLV